MSLLHSIHHYVNLAYQEDETLAMMLAFEELQLQNDYLLALDTTLHDAELNSIASDIFIQDLSIAEGIRVSEMSKCLVQCADRRLAEKIGAAEIAAIDEEEIDGLVSYFPIISPSQNQIQNPKKKDEKGKEIAIIQNSEQNDAIELDVFDYEDQAGLKAKEVSCGICFEPLIFGGGQCSSTCVHGDLFPTCSHPFCIGCIKTWLHGILTDSTCSFPITCPESGCLSQLEPDTKLEQWLDDPALFLRFHSRFIESTEKTMFCPQKECGQLVILPANNRVGQCVCGTLLCCNCKVIEHFGITCAQYQALPIEERTNEDVSLIKLAAAQNWARCPTCKTVVEKQFETDCNYVKCVCGVGFCYICGLPYAGLAITPAHPHGKPPCNCSLFDPRDDDGQIIARPPGIAAFPEARDILPGGALFVPADEERHVIPRIAAIVEARVFVPFIPHEEDHGSSDDELFSIASQEDIPRQEEFGIFDDQEDDRREEDYGWSDDGLVSINDQVDEEYAASDDYHDFVQDIDWNRCNIADHYLNTKKKYLPKWLARSFSNLSCYDCGRVFVNLQALESHLLNTKQHDVFICCDRPFQTKNCLNNHHRRCH
jgi:hypothetical protein